jgi:hypothetical protein
MHICEKGETFEAIKLSLRELQLHRIEDLARIDRLEKKIEILEKFKSDFISEIIKKTFLVFTVVTTTMATIIFVLYNLISKK